MEISNILDLFLKKIIHILVIILMFVIIGILYTYKFITPKYESYTSLVLSKINNTSNGETESITTADVTLNQKLVSTYGELIKSKNVLREVINNSDINVSEEQLGSNITVKSVSNTDVIKIIVTDEDPYVAKTVANEIAKVFCKKVSEIYNINNINILDEAELQTEPYNINHTRDVIMFTVTGICVSMLYVLIINVFDTTIKSKEDVERKLGVTVLVTIPVCNFDELPKAVKKGGRR